MWLAFCGLGDGDTPTSDGKAATHQDARSTHALECMTEDQGDNDDEEMPMLGYRNGNRKGEQHSSKNQTSKASDRNGSGDTPLEPRP